VATYTVGYLVGSLASDSINRTLSKALVRLAPPRLELTEIAIGSCRSTAATTTRTIRPQGVR
jgi:chromate reductase